MITSGMVVRLISGGPKMTVRATDGYGRAEVIWFDKHGVLHESIISKALLTKDNDDE